MTGVLGVWSRTTSSKLPAHDIIGLNEVLTRYIGFRIHGNLGTYITDQVRVTAQSNLLRVSLVRLAYSI